MCSLTSELCDCCVFLLKEMNIHINCMLEENDDGKESV